jgi:hypothetical protein
MAGGIRGRQISDRKILASEPLDGAPFEEGSTGPDVRLVAGAEDFARGNGFLLKGPAEYATAAEARAQHIAAAYDAMPHAPGDPEVAAAYEDMIAQPIGQYEALIDTE